MTLLKSSDKSFAAQLSLCRKQCRAAASGATRLINSTTPLWLPVIAAAPSVQTPTQFAQVNPLPAMNSSFVEDLLDCCSPC